MHKRLSPTVNLCEKENKCYVELDFSNFDTQNFILESSGPAPSAASTDKKYTITVKEVEEGENVQHVELEGFSAGDNIEIEIKDYPTDSLTAPQNKGKVIIKFETVGF